MHFSAVLFDLDGTLLDTIPDLADSANALRQEMGMEPISQEILSTYVGRGFENLVIRALSHDGQPADVQTVMRGITRYPDYYRKFNGRRARLFPGTIEGLEAFRSTGARLAVVTNKLTEFTGPLLAQAGIAHYFDAVVCGDTCAQRKPDPAPVLHACELLSVQPHEALFIGDSINDAQAANAAGVRVLAVPYGYNEGQPVQALPVDAIVDSIAAAAEWAASADCQTQNA